MFKNLSLMLRLLLVALSPLLAQSDYEARRTPADLNDLQAEQGIFNHSII